MATYLIDCRLWEISAFPEGEDAILKDRVALFRHRVHAREKTKMEGIGYLQRLQTVCKVDIRYQVHQVRFNSRYATRRKTR